MMKRFSLQCRVHRDNNDAPMYHGFYRLMIDMHAVRCIAGSNQDLPILSGEFIARLYRIGIPIAPVQFIFENCQREWMHCYLAQYNLQIIEL